jgi:hypothetical protein
MRSRSDPEPAPVLTPADHVAALAEVEGAVQQRLIAAQTRLAEAERARLTAAIRLGEAEVAARHRQLVALAVARRLLAERAEAADRLAAHSEESERP